MLRGIQKRMIVCKPPCGSRFEYAYFVLRDDRKAPAEDKDAMMREVERILAESIGRAKSEKKKAERTSGRALRRALWLFLGGAICGALPFAVALIFS